MALCMSAMCAFSQGMSDSQVIQFVQKEQTNGSDQQTIVQKLLQKGVSVEQLRRIRKKYETEQSQMGAVDLMGGQTKDKTKTRLRNGRHTQPRSICR